MPHPELPNDAPANDDPKVDIGRQIIDPTKAQHCQEFSRSEFMASMAEYAAEEEAKRIEENSKNPFKRVTFKIETDDFVEFVAHKPTPEPIERLYDTTTQQQLLGLPNPNPPPRRDFVWRRWMWLPTALLVGSAFLVGAALSQKPRRAIENQGAVPTPSAPALVVQKGATVPEPTSSSSAEAESALKPLAPKASATQPSTKPIPKSEPKRVREPTPKGPVTTIPQSPYAKTPFTPVD